MWQKLVHMFYTVLLPESISWGFDAVHSSMTHFKLYTAFFLMQWIWAKLQIYKYRFHWVKSDVQPLLWSTSLILVSYFTHARLKQGQIKLLSSFTINLHNKHVLSAFDRCIKEKCQANLQRKKQQFAVLIFKDDNVKIMNSLLLALVLQISDYQTVIIFSGVLLLSCQICKCHVFSL